MKKTVFIAVILLMISVSKAQAQRQGLRTFGEMNCGDWIKEQSPTNQTWLMGLLTGMNIGPINSNNDLANLKSSNQALLWMDNYCQSNPLKMVSEGGVALFRELGNSAKKKKPATQ